MAKQYYAIVSQLNQFALDVKGSSKAAGTPVVTWTKTYKDNQQWYDDQATGTIRSKLNDYCMEIKDGILVLKPHEPGNTNQLWIRHGNYILHRFIQSDALAISAADKEKGTTLTRYQFNGKPSQCWTFEFIGATIPRKEFFIVSEANGKAIDIKGGEKEIGVSVVIWSKGTQTKNQRWYLDQQSFIRSAFNDMVFIGSLGECLKMVPYSDKPDSQWSFDGNKVVNKSGNVLDINKGNPADGTEVCASEPNSTAHQRWKMEIIN